MFECILQINQKLYFIGVGAIFWPCRHIYVKSQYSQLRWVFEWYLNMNVKLSKLRVSTTLLLDFVRYASSQSFTPTKTGVYFPSRYNSCIFFFLLWFDGTKAIILILNYTLFSKDTRKIYFLNSIPERVLYTVTLIAFGFYLDLTINFMRRHLSVCVQSSRLLTKSPNKTITFY